MGLRLVVTTSGQHGDLLSLFRRQRGKVREYDPQSAGFILLAEAPPLRGMPPLPMVHKRCGGGRGRGVQRIPRQRSSAVCLTSLRVLCLLARAMRFINVVAQHVEVGPSHTIQAPSPSFHGGGGNQAAGPAVEVAPSLGEGATPPNESHLGFYSRYFLVSKKSGKQGAILDLCLFNKSVAMYPCVCACLLISICTVA